MFACILVLLVASIACNVARMGSKTNGTDSFCWPRPHTRVSKLPLFCTSIQTQIGPLCLEDCRAGYKSIGLLCWRGWDSYLSVSMMGCGDLYIYADGMCRSKCPKSTIPARSICKSKCSGQKPIKCGAGCSESHSECKKSIWGTINASVLFFENLASLIAMASNIGVGGASSAWWPLVIAPVEMATLTTIKYLMGERLNKFSDLPKNIASTIVDQLVDAATKGKKVDWAKMDATGISQLVRLFSHTQCPDYSSFRV